MVPPPPVDTLSSDSEDEPESLPLVQSKKDVQQQENALKKAQMAVKERKRAQNREKDRKLKERAEAAKRTGRKGERGPGRAVVSGKRGAGASADGDGNGDEEDGEMAVDDARGNGEGDSDKNDVSSDAESPDDDDDDKMGAPKQLNPDHLPDHLFASAFQAPPPTPRTKPAAARAPTHPRRQRTQTPKDVLLGSKAIRTLSDPASRPPTASTLPPRKVQEFLDRSLGLAGGDGRSKATGWVRRPANIGVLKTSGPALGFVRKR